MSLHLRQICLAARDLEMARAQFVGVFGIEPCFTDPDIARFGVRNCLFQIGTDFLEIVSPLGSETPLARFLERTGADAGYMLIAQAGSRTIQDDIRRRAQRIGIRVAWEATHRDADFLQWNPADTGGTFLETSFDHAADPTGRWSAAGGDIGPDNGLHLRGAVVTTHDPMRTARKWAELTNCPLDEANSRLSFAGTFIDFRAPSIAGLQTGIARIALTPPDPELLVRRARAAQLPVDPRGFILCGVQIDLFG